MPVSRAGDPLASVARWRSRVAALHARHRARVETQRGRISVRVPRSGSSEPAERNRPPVANRSSLAQAVHDVPDMEELMESLREALASVVAFLPNLIAGLVVLAIGWLIAWVIARVVRGVLPRLGFDRFLAKHRLTDRPPETRPGSRVVASAAFWVVMLIALMEATATWGLRAVANGLGQVLAYLPNVVAAVLIFGAALVVGNWVHDRMRSAPAQERLGVTILPGAVRAGILTIGAFIALRQLLIAPEILIIGFALVFGAIAVATALAFGLGGRRAAERMTEEWYDRQQRRRGGAVRPPTEVASAS